MKVIEIESFTDILKIKNSNYAKFTCIKCGKVSKLYGKYFLLHPFVCKVCFKKNFDWSERSRKVSEALRNRTVEEINKTKEKTRQTNLVKYGGHPATRPEQIERTKQTCLKRYGSVSPASNEMCKKKYRETCEKIYGKGIINAFQAQTVKEKSRQSCLKKYGVKNIKQSADFEEKIRQTNLKRYGGTGFASEITSAKYRDTCKEKYGCESSNSASIVKRHRVEKLIERHGDLHTAYIESFRTYRSTKAVVYKYDDVFFNSMPELCFYIYHHEFLKDGIKRGPAFEFFVDNKPHQYICDFQIDNELFELKGPHLWKNDRLISVFSADSEEYLLAKTDCMKRHNVKVIITDSEPMKQIQQEVFQKYSKEYLEGFRYEGK